MLRERIAAQLGRPTGRTGRLVATVLNRGNRATNARAVDHLEVRPGHRALDVGFGGGVGLAMLLERGAADVAGVDRSPDMVAAARRRFGDRVRVEVASVEALPFEDAAFDRVLGVHTVYFWPDPQAAVGELARVLAPGGRLVLALQPREVMEGRAVHEHGFTLYSRDEIAALLRAAFTDVRVEGDRMLFAIAGR